MIRGYPRYPSLFAGETLTLHVSTDSSRFRVEFYRQGAGLERMDGVAGRTFQGVDVPNGPPDVDWGWPAFEFAIPADWPSGAYVAMLIEIAADGSETAPDTATTFATAAKALFVVRARGPVPAGTPLYKISWATFVAYNGTGYGSLYTEALWSRERPNPGFKVTWRRPGCGTGGDVMPGDSEDYYDRSSRRQTFEHWDAPFVRWLERSGYRPHYCTDWDMHQDPGLLDPYSLLLSTGHDEYWSDAMRASYARHIARGGNVAFFSGNISGYRFHLTDADTALTCAKVTPPAKDPDTWQWDVWVKFNPESAVTGTLFAFGGGWWDGRRDAVGYTVQHADHWIFAGTGLAEGDVFGNDEDFPLVGYEVDGVAFRRRGDGYAVPTGELGTPPDFVILGIAELGPGWVTSRPGAAATMGVFVSPQGGTVFQGATTDWPILVPRSAAVEAITRNIVERLRHPTARIVGPLPHRGGRMLAAAGETVSFQVDTGRFGAVEGLDIAWEVAGHGTGGGARLIEAAGPVARVAMPTAPGFVTVSAEIRRGGDVVGFGTRTVMPLSEVEALKLEILVAMREMVMAGEPSNPLVNPTTDPSERMRLLYSIRIPWIRDRAARIEKAAAALMASDGGRQGPTEASPDRGNF